MCVAIACVGGVPTDKELEECAEVNDDGGGAAWVENGVVHYEKGLEAKDVQRFIADGVLKPPALIHFRVASSGGKTQQLCHPFPISEDVSIDMAGKAGAVMIHNGHWSGWTDRLVDVALRRAQKLTAGPWSDSRALAWLAYQVGDPIFEFAENQRIATLDSDGVIKTWGDWFEDSARGVWYSNRGWVGGKRYTVRIFNGKEWRDADDRNYGYPYHGAAWHYPPGGPSHPKGECSKHGCNRKTGPRGLITAGNERSIADRLENGDLSELSTSEAADKVHGEARAIGMTDDEYMRVYGGCMI